MNWLLPLLLFWNEDAALAEQHARMWQAIADSGRVVEFVSTPSERVTLRRQLAPGAPPLLAFRYLEGKSRHRFGDMDLVLDDANH